MHLRSLRLRNYRVYRAADIEFPDGLVGIYGPNGAGKSSIIESVRYALYGDARTEKSELRTAGINEDVRVELVFEHEGNSYEVRRVLKGRNLTPTVEVYVNRQLAAQSARPRPPRRPHASWTSCASWRPWPVPRRPARAARRSATSGARWRPTRWPPSSRPPARGTLSWKRRPRRCPRWPRRWRRTWSGRACCAPSRTRGAASRWPGGRWPRPSGSRPRPPA